MTRPVADEARIPAAGSVSFASLEAIWRACSGELTWGRSETR
jgi:hypothetical protein